MTRDAGRPEPGESAPRHQRATSPESAEKVVAPGHAVRADREELEGAPDDDVAGEAGSKDDRADGSDS